MAAHAPGTVTLALPFGKCQWACHRGRRRGAWGIMPRKRPSTGKSESLLFEYRLTSCRREQSRSAVETHSFDRRRSQPASPRRRSFGGAALVLRVRRTRVPVATAEDVLDALHAEIAGRPEMRRKREHLIANGAEGRAHPRVQRECVQPIVEGLRPPKIEGESQPPARAPAETITAMGDTYHVARGMVRVVARDTRRGCTRPCPGSAALARRLEIRPPEIVQLLWRARARIRSTCA